MSLKNTYRGVSTLRGGPAGWHCPCCNPYGQSPRKMKPLARRLYRRGLKQQLHQVCRDYGDAS
jgi:hypothetical protein